MAGPSAAILLGHDLDDRGLGGTVQKFNRAVGLLHLWEGDTARARVSLERALAEYERLSNPFEAARTREYLAEALPASERGPVLDAALREYEQLGAAPCAQRVHARLKDVVQTSR